MGSGDFGASFKLGLITFFVTTLLTFSSTVYTIRTVGSLFECNSRVLAGPRGDLSVARASLFTSGLGSSIRSVCTNDNLVA